ncbi:MAG: hypothetical protein AMXMBFR13_43090 [Phycisphaerae bacterium]
MLLSGIVQASQFSFLTPSDDRWQYPFNFTPGTRAVASCFGSPGTPDFNDRDGIIIVAWNTSGSLPPSQGADAYGVKSVTVRLTSQKGSAWPTDLTVDEWFTYDANGDDVLNADGIPRGQVGDTDGESDDEDLGRTIELFGAGFGSFYSPQTWTENSLFIGSASDANVPRDPFPFVFQEGTWERLHVEDNVKGLHNDQLAQPVIKFTPVPWAIGKPVGYVPGNQPVPFEVIFEVDLDLSAGHVRHYFQEQLDQGRLFVVVTSLKEAAIQGAQSGFPTFFTKEGAAFDLAAEAPRLDLHACLAVAPDFDRDCDVDAFDVQHFEACRTGPAVGPPGSECLNSDFDHDWDVDQEDFAILQRCFSGPDAEPDPGCAS